MFCLLPSYVISWIVILCWWCVLMFQSRLPDHDLIYFLTHREIGHLLKTRSASLIARYVYLLIIRYVNTLHCKLLIIRYVNTLHVKLLIIRYVNTLCVKLLLAQYLITLLHVVINSLVCENIICWVIKSSVFDYIILCSQ